MSSLDNLFNGPKRKHFTLEEVLVEVGPFWDVRIHSRNKNKMGTYTQFEAYNINGGNEIEISLMLESVREEYDGAISMWEVGPTVYEANVKAGMIDPNIHNITYRSEQ